ncbi:MAG TPA: ABC transporter ATP-binding protein [Gammaproteobacteria bacterium]|nr:ABC transporter ATP-binding protein [Gammaproteobacteria bacterium]
MSAPVLVDIQQLTRDFGPLRAVDEISFQVHQGEVLGFLGPNGAGKSSTMQMITGNLAPTSGQIQINGIDLLDSPKQAKAQIGYLPEQPPIYPDLTVDEYLRYAAKLNGIKGSAIKSAVEQAKLRCGLEKVGARLAGNLSKGFQQRVGIAQAIIHSPKVVIFDEPTVGLDPIQIREIRALIQELKSDHSVILSTHILPEVQTMCDRVLMINRGKLLMSEAMNALLGDESQSTLLVGFNRALEISALQTIPSIQQVEALADNRYRLVTDAPIEAAETIVKRSVAEDWHLIELHQEKRSLEQVFVDTVYNDQGEVVTS